MPAVNIGSALPDRKIGSTRGECSGGNSPEW